MIAVGPDAALTDCLPLLLRIHGVAIFADFIVEQQQYAVTPVRLRPMVPDIPGKRHVSRLRALQSGTPAAPLCPCVRDENALLPSHLAVGPSAGSGRSDT